MTIISQYNTTLLNAGPKAKLDIEKILVRDYQCKKHTLILSGKEEKDKIHKFIYKIKKALFCIRFFRGRDIIFMQFPLTNEISVTKNAKNKIALVHDLEGLRRKNKEIEDKEIKFLDTCKFIVVHNEKMKNYLVSKNIQNEKIYILELFDYLCCKDEFSQNSAIDQNNINVIYTGNLDKATFLKQLDSNKMNFCLNLYGSKNMEFENKKIIYKGKFLPDDLPSKIEGNLGLVWDGNIDETDENDQLKNYTKYNTPHKLSCYIAAGIPEKSAISDLVKKYDIGYVINNIYDINDINLIDYNKKKENIIKLSKKVQNGYFTKRVVNEILNIYKKMEEHNIND